MRGKDARMIEPVVIEPSMAEPCAGSIFWYRWTLHEEGTLSQAAAEA